MSLILLCTVRLNVSCLRFESVSVYLPTSIGVVFVIDPCSLKARVVMSFHSASLPCIFARWARAKKSLIISSSVSRSTIFQGHAFIPSRNISQVKLPLAAGFQSSNKLLLSASSILGTFPMQHSSLASLYMIRTSFSLVSPFLSLSNSLNKGFTRFFSHSISCASEFCPNFFLFSSFLLGTGMPT
jgi:hypothetical protein